jgi:hypothetical protein
MIHIEGHSCMELCLFFFCPGRWPRVTHAPIAVEGGVRMEQAAVGFVGDGTTCLVGPISTWRLAQIGAASPRSGGMYSILRLTFKSVSYMTCKVVITCISCMSPGLHAIICLASCGKGQGEDRLAASHIRSCIKWAMTWANSSPLWMAPCYTVILTTL